MTPSDRRSGMWASVVRTGFHLLYNELAWTYDIVSWVVSLGQWRRWQQVALPFVIGPSVLEIGHGPGHMLADLQRRGFQAVGLDLSPFMGWQARRRLQRSGLFARLVRGPVQQLPFANGRFNTVLATFPTEYLVDPAALAEVRRVLARDGRFIIVPGAVLTGAGPLTRFIEWLYRITGQRQAPFDLDGKTEVANHPTWQLLRSRFQAAGLLAEFHHIPLRNSTVTLIIAHPFED